jgi:DNA-binding CsgD family transcriptional regulator
MIVATYRPGEIDSHAGRILARLRREDCCAELELPGLSESETTELITGLGYRRPSHQLVATVFEATRGSPLFVGEAMHHLTASGSLIERGGYLATERPASDLKLPAEVTEAIEQRLASVEGDARTVLNLAACLGDWFSWRALQLSSGLEEEACLAALSQCVEGGLIEADGASFRFAHPLVRRVAHRSIIAPRRERLHKAIAEALAEVYADSFDEHIAEIANHLLAAGTQADAESVVEHAKRAADTALSVFAWRDAARYYEGAIQAAERSRQFSPRDVAELHAIAGYAWYRDMDPGPSLEHYGQAIEGFGRTGDSRGLVQALTERARLQLTLASIPYGTLLDLNPIQEAISQLRGEDSDVQAKALALMSTAYWHARMPEESERVAGEAFALARASGDEVTAVHALNNRGMARLSSLDLEGALADFETSLEIARPLGDPWLLGWPLPRICPVLITLGRLDEVEAYVEEACRVTTQTGDWGDLSVALAYRIVHCYFLGDFDGVERHALEGLQAARRSRYPWGAAVFLPTLASARTMWGAADEAQDAIQALIEPGSIIDDPGVTLNAVGRIFGTLVSAAAGDEEPGRARLPRMLGAARAAGRRDIQSLASYCALAEIAAYLGDAAAAEEQYEPLLFARDRGAVLCSSWGFLIPRVLGLISSVNGRWEEAERHFADALETARRTGVRPELGRTLLDYATMLNTRRSREDQQGAAKMLEQAAAIFGEFAMTPFVERAAALAAKVGATPPAATRAESARYPDNLSGREVEVLLLLTRGYTNNRIAEELVLSVKTVARHMSNIFVKISVDSRSAATAYAFERGLVERSGQGRRLP